MTNNASCVLGMVLLAVVTVPVTAQEDLASFWQRGKVRELYSGEIVTKAEQAKQWAEAGANSLTGASPKLAHDNGLKTRTWFTMNYMDSRSMSEETIKSMSARGRDGGYLRPSDPLFPTVGQYGWSACVNNPGWIARAQDEFRAKARDGYDGCHVDYAGHYEPCFCEHCKAEWDEWAAGNGLGGMSLERATDATEIRTRMLVREFRIQCVMQFLGGLRQAAREIKPGYALDGTWHQDNGSAYQWAYGDHFDLMCIEGTTHGPFPPTGTQIPFLKAAHALSARPDRAPVAMSVTYHLLKNEQGAMRHGRMAPDRLRVALAEIISQGGVSWLGLGGPGTGNLLKEHQDTVKAYFSVARDLEPLLVAGRDVAEIGIVFPVKSYLLTGDQRAQLYAFCHAMMKGHIPFRIVSDVNLQPEDIADLAGVVVLSARALSDSACATLYAFAASCGALLIMGDDAATLTEDWLPRQQRPEFAVPPPRKQGDPDILSHDFEAGRCYYWTESPFAGRSLGAAQYVAFSQTTPAPVAIEGWSKAVDVSGDPDANYSLYVDLQHTEGTPLWGQTAQFSTGTHDWEFSRQIIRPTRPLKSANVHMLFRQHRGTVWFKDVKFGVWNEAKQQIEENLLAEVFRGKSGEAYTAAPGQRAASRAWGPYGEGYELENMLDMGLWVKMSSSKGLSMGDMTQADPTGTATIIEALAPLRWEQKLLVVEGEGAESVYVDLSENGDRLLVQMVNYAAELHPQLPELEQQKQDRSIPARNLVVTLRRADLRPEGAAVYSPERDAKVTCEAADGGVRLKVGELHQYCAVSLPLVRTTTH